MVSIIFLHVCLILLGKIVLCRKFYWAKFTNYKGFHMNLSFRQQRTKSGYWHECLTLQYGPRDPLRISQGVNRWRVKAQPSLLPEKCRSGLPLVGSPLVVGRETHSTQQWHFVHDPCGDEPLDAFPAGNFPQSRLYTIALVVSLSLPTLTPCSNRSILQSDLKKHTGRFRLFLSGCACEYLCSKGT